jgi:hypothetical protein
MVKEGFKESIKKSLVFKNKELEKLYQNAKKKRRSIMKVFFKVVLFILLFGLMLFPLVFFLTARSERAWCSIFVLCCVDLLLLSDFLIFKIKKLLLFQGFFLILGSYLSFFEYFFFVFQSTLIVNYS